MSTATQLADHSITLGDVLELLAKLKMLGWRRHFSDRVLDLFHLRVIPSLENVNVTTQDCLIDKLHILLRV